MRIGTTLFAVLVIGLAAGEVAAQERAPRQRPAGAGLLTVETDLAASCRVVDARGASRTREFGAPATIALAARAAGDQVVCVRDGREVRAAVPATGRRVAVSVGGASAAATPVRRLVTPADVHPYPGTMRLTAKAEQDLVWLRQRFEEGAIDERAYFAHRRDVIARGAVLEPSRAVARRSTSTEPAATPRALTGRGQRAG